MLGNTSLITKKALIYLRNKSIDFNGQNSLYFPIYLVLVEICYVYANLIIITNIKSMKHDKVLDFCVKIIQTSFKQPTCLCDTCIYITSIYSRTDFL